MIHKDIIGMYLRRLTSAARCIAGVLFLALAAGAQAEPLQVFLKPGSAPATVRVELLNTGSVPVSILRWDTPFEPVLSQDVFRIEAVRKGWEPSQAARYDGREVKRALPSRADYLLLPPATMISSEVALDRYYLVDGTGSQRVRFTGTIRYDDSNTLLVRTLTSKDLLDGLKEASVQSNTVTVDFTLRNQVRILPPAYNECSAQQQGDVFAAAEVAQQIISTAVADLNSLAPEERAPSPRYSAWFGAYTQQRFDQVLSNFRSISQALDGESIRFDCDCDEEGVYAYVYPLRPYNVYLCPAFWQAETAGVDSRAGTIVHEMSHFEILAATDDHVYSAQAARSLALSNPDLAINNADNYEYFAENTPPIAIRGSLEDPATVYPVLAAGELVEASLPQGGTANYQVTGADRIELNSLSGDADLYVYADAALTSRLCASNYVVGLDSCATFSTTTVYVQVVAYSASTFTLRAARISGPTTDIPRQLTPDVSVSDSLAEAERQVYTVTGANLVELISHTGDADLYVFNSPDFTHDTLVCAAAQVTSVSAVDRCNIPDDLQTRYVLVTAFTNSDYSLLARTVPSTSNGSSIDKGWLVADQAVSGSVREGNLDNYMASGVASIRVTTVSGDADLIIYDSADRSSNDIICMSEQYSIDSLVDQCDLPDSADYYVSVFGFTDATYTLLASTAPNDDPGPPLSGSGSGGGALNVVTLAILLLSCGFRPASRRGG